ncbi:MAG TPA: murein hydrolase regulator LrgA [Lachnospiraceae bacterium]|nr:murein hydrolase regulator LrgA [Lachnospiraceae bacterium]
MKILRQFCRIMIITLIGELLHWLLPLPVPASIYGMAILFAGLVTGLVKLDQVRDAGKFLIEIMPVMFIPAGVGLMSSWGDLRPVLLPVSVITVVSLIAVMVVSGKVSQHVIRLGSKTEAGSLLSMENMAAEEEAEL